MTIYRDREEKRNAEPRGKTHKGFHIGPWKARDKDTKRLKRQCSLQFVEWLNDLISNSVTEHWSLTGGPEGPGGPLLSCEQVQAWGMGGHCSSTLWGHRHTHTHTAQIECADDLVYIQTWAASLTTSPTYIHTYLNGRIMWSLLYYIILVVFLTCWAAHVCGMDKKTDTPYNIYSNAIQNITTTNYSLKFTTKFTQHFWMSIKADNYKHYKDVALVDCIRLYRCIKLTGPQCICCVVICLGC